jgi:uncharacterized protein
MTNFMKCPACDRSLAEQQIDNLRVEVCRGGCGGIWFDSFELPQLAADDASSEESLLRVERDPRLQLDPARPRLCPRCAGVEIRRVLFSPGGRAGMGECPKCGGCWLEHGELAEIYAERYLMGDAGQKGSAGASDELMRYLYEVRTGRRNKSRWP